MSALVVALTGYSGTGKSTLADYARTHHGFNVFEGSSYIRRAAAEAGRSLRTRIDYDNYFVELQLQRGLPWLANLALGSGHERLLQSGLRAKADFKRIKSVGGYVIALDCPAEICLPRIDSSDPKNPSTVAEYAEATRVENRGDEIGTRSAWCIENADYRLDTSETLAETTRAFDEIMGQVAGQQR